MVSDDQMSSKEMNMLQYENQIGYLLWNRVGWILIYIFYETEEIDWKMVHFVCMGIHPFSTSMNSNEVFMLNITSVLSLQYAEWCFGQAKNIS